jgi:molybdate transport system substrate-binding protein
VETVSMFPESTHEPIVYPLALLKGASAQSKDFYEYLKSAKARAIFTQYGFTILIK